MSTKLRDSSKTVLSKVLKKKKNIDIFEKNIYIKSKNDVKRYKTILYQVVGDILMNKDVNSVLASIKEDDIEWNHEAFTEYINKQKEQDDFIENPIEVVEGIFTCKCGSKRVLSYTKQVRSSDEPMTTFAQCVECSSKWTYSG